MTSRKFVVFRFTWIVILSPSSLNVSIRSFLILSTCLPGAFLKMARPSSRYRPMLFLSYFSARVLSMKMRTNSQISAPSKLPMVTSNRFFKSFFIQDLSSSKRSDFCEWWMISNSSSEIGVCCLAN